MSALLVAAARRWNTPTVVQAASGFGTAPHTVTLPGTVAGRTLIGIAGGSTSPNVNLPSPWTLAIAGGVSTTNSARAHIWRRVSPGGDVATTLGGTATNASLIVLEVDDATTIVTRTAQAGDAGADIATLTMDLTAPVGPSLVVVAVGANGTTSSKALSGCTLVAPTLRVAVGYRVVSGGAQSITFTTSTARRLNGVVAAFRPTKT